MPTARWPNSAIRFGPSASLKGVEVGFAAIRHDQEPSDSSPNPFETASAPHSRFGAIVPAIPGISTLREVFDPARSRAARAWGSSKKPRRFSVKNALQFRRMVRSVGQDAGQDEVVGRIGDDGPGQARPDNLVRRLGQDFPSGKDVDCRNSRSLRSSEMTSESDKDARSGAGTAGVRRDDVPPGLNDLALKASSNY